MWIVKRTVNKGNRVEETIWHLSSSHLVEDIGYAYLCVAYFLVTLQ